MYLYARLKISMLIQCINNTRVKLSLDKNTKSSLKSDYCLKTILETRVKFLPSE
jgi:hypothetical protein